MNWYWCFQCREYKNTNSLTCPDCDSILSLNPFTKRQMETYKSLILKYDH